MPGDVVPSGRARPQLRLPPLPRAGDRVALIAPAGPVPPDRIERGLAWLRSLGLDPVPGRHLSRRGGHGLAFLAGDDDDRAADLQEAWCDPRVAAVLCARGGDGTPRLLQRLDWRALAAAQPKPLAGLSDVTALHQAFARRLGVATLWSPMPCTPVLCGPEADATSQQRLAAALLHPGAAVDLSGRPLVGGRATAALVGGTLASLSAMVATPDCMPAAGAIAVLEDLGEAPYRVERFLTHLRRAGWLDGVAGVACGDWTACGDPAELDAVLRDRLGDLGVPVVLGLPFGHGPVQSSLWLGRPALLDGDAGRLLQHEPDETGPS
ncbi:MAG: LD-carboxypeptidase [Euzebyales bacterium]|nr:LD-carboxypeptidase [Euzebyales bacterium]